MLEDLIRALRFVQNYNGAITAIATVVVMGATVVYAKLTMGLLNENRLLRKAGTEPNVVAYLMPDKNEPNVINIIVANVGKGPAFNIYVKYLTDVATLKAFNVKTIFDGKNEFLSILPADERVVCFLGVAFSLRREQDRLEDFDIEVSFRDVSKKLTTNICRANLSGLMRVSRIRDDHTREISKHIKEIAEAVKGWSRNSRLKIETISHSEQRRIDAERDEEYAAFIAAQKAGEANND